MSRSYRKQPFMAIAGDVSSKKDKQIAHRCERRTHKRLITLASKEDDFEDFVPPLRSECSHNNVYGWNRDGKQRYQVPTQKDWMDYLVGEDTWPPAWYINMMRK